MQLLKKLISPFNGERFQWASYYRVVQEVASPHSSRVRGCVDILSILLVLWPPNNMLVAELVILNYS